ncbi:hypothetical protein TWF730_002915 [Orbilia blumenaviensis]|uniref:Uncharacterized protein n=1 Tax=Orbilia blumenaviensis TaxID=1796055 RepID=A0AAV9UBU7_9PEZI
MSTPPSLDQQTTGIMGVDENNNMAFLGPDTSSPQDYIYRQDTEEDPLLAGGPYNLVECYGPRQRENSLGSLMIEAGKKLATLEEETHNQKVRIRSLQTLLGFAFARIEKLENFIRVVPQSFLDEPGVAEVYDNIWGPWDVAHGLRNRNRFSIPNLIRREDILPVIDDEDEENRQPCQDAEIPTTIPELRAPIV